METLNQITSFFASIWQVFNINHPLLGIPLSRIYLGTFAIAFSVMILRPILGIGGGVISDITSQSRNSVKSYETRIRARKENRKAQEKAQSYETYKANRARMESYARRYRKGE